MPLEHGSSSDQEHEKPEIDFQLLDKVSVLGRSGEWIVRSILDDGRVTIVPIQPDNAPEQARATVQEPVGIWSPLTIDPAHLALIARAGEY